MGAFSVDISVGGIERRQWLGVRAEVDTSQPLSFLPASMLRGLEISPAMNGSVVFPDGVRKRAELGYAWLKLGDREAMTHFVFSNEDIHPSLGRVAINSLLLE